MKSVEEYFYLYYDLKDEMIRLSKEGNDIRKAFITKIYCVPKSEVKSNYNDLKKIVRVLKGGPWLDKLILKFGNGEVMAFKYNEKTLSFLKKVTSEYFAVTKDIKVHSIAII